MESVFPKVYMTLVMVYVCGQFNSNKLEFDLYN